MLGAEHRAISTGQVVSNSQKEDDEPDMEDLSPVKGAPLKWYNAAIPVLAVIFVTIFGLMDTGFAGCFDSLAAMGQAAPNEAWSSIWNNMAPLTAQEDPSFFMKLGMLIGKSDSYVALLWASLSGVMLAIALTLFGRIMNLFNVMNSMVTGFKAMLPALIILTLAWALASTTEELQTAHFLTASLRDAISPYLIPAVVFILAALISFSTGSSWSTMAILYPIAIPTSWAISMANGLAEPEAMELLLNVISVVLAASVLGDHCSPISDTTILSSLASDCNHIEHVRTQMPYALVVGLISLFCCIAASYLGGGLMLSLILLAVSVALLFLIVNKLGKNPAQFKP